MERTVAVWFANEVPVRLVWEGQRFRVNDTPTPLSADDILWHPTITHPPCDAWRGWRFQAVDDAGQSAVFDIRQFDSAHWVLLAVHDYLPEQDHPAARRASAIERRFDPGDESARAGRNREHHLIAVRWVPQGVGVEPKRAD